MLSLSSLQQTLVSDLNISHSAKLSSLVSAGSSLLLLALYCPILTLLALIPSAFYILTPEHVIHQNTYYYKSIIRQERDEVRGVVLGEVEQHGPVDGVEADEGDGEGNSGHPLNITGSHTTQCCWSWLNWSN